VVPLVGLQVTRVGRDQVAEGDPAARNVAARMVAAKRDCDLQWRQKIGDPGVSEPVGDLYEILDDEQRVTLNELVKDFRHMRG